VLEAAEPLPPDCAEPLLDWAEPPPELVDAEPLLDFADAEPLLDFADAEPPLDFVDAELPPEASWRISAVVVPADGRDVL
jgi:hypothetical protein